MIDLTRDEIEALLELRRIAPARLDRGIAGADFLAALDRAVVKLHVEQVHQAMVMIPVTESELRLLDGNR